MTLRDSGNALLVCDVREAPPQHALVMLVGELDTSNVNQLSEVLAELSRKGIRHISLNLAELDFIDSTGLSAIIAAHKRAESAGGELMLFSPQAATRELLVVSGVNQYLNVRPPTA